MHGFARRAWKGLKTACGLLGILVCGILVAAAVLVWRPEWFLTPPLLAKLVQKYGQPYHLKWTELTVSIRSKSLRDKEISLKTNDLCFRASSDTLKGCFKRIDGAFTVELGLGPKLADLVTLAEVDHFDVDGRTLQIDNSHPAAPPQPKKKPRSASSGYHDLAQFLPDSLRELRIREMDVRLPKTTLMLASTTTIDGDLSVSFSSAQAPPLRLSARLYYDTPLKSENLDARVAVDSDLFTKGRLTFLKAVGRLRGDVGDSASFDALLSQKSKNETALKAGVRVVNGTRRLRAGLTGTATAGGLKGRLTALLSDSTGTVRELTVRRCDIDAPLGQNQALEALSIDCRIAAVPPALGNTPGRPENQIEARVSLDAKMKPSLLAGDRFEATLAASVGPLKQWYDFHANLTAQLGGRLRDLPKSLTSKHKIEAGLGLAKFQELVKLLQGTAYAIPAPLHVLDGPVEVTLESTGDTSKPDQLFTYHARTDLSSGRQKVAVAVDGKVLARQLFAPGRRFEDQTEVALKNVALELPFLKLGPVPAVTVDSRIRTGEEVGATPAEEGPDAIKTSTPTRVTYRAHIATVNPIVLYTNLNPNPIPIALDLDVSTAGPTGTITVQTFEADLFKRKADIRYVTLRSEPGVKSMTIDGLILFKMPDADISVKLLGTTEKPQVVFESDPPLNQQDIVAMLLFGKSPDDLDPDQKTTASNSQSAMASGAFGLASLYLFASTPIQYVGYDPATQSYAMKFSLPGGASLEVGSNSQQSSHLTLRKRLARHWVIATEVQRNSTTATNPQPQNAVTTFLEWFQRY